MGSYSTKSQPYPSSSNAPAVRLRCSGIEGRFRQELGLLQMRKLEKKPSLIWACLDEVSGTEYGGWENCPQFQFVLWDRFFLL
ncbi:hypothetical protein MRB53_027969 [Persea americana]|uniref:Uncharacterized protein n=1 Tax=Persea americana TaxID=3435 RepID=A0ACC2KE63_PERAE|nr:hypothetical protein MRB53_027969 [Persea americana]